MAYTKSKTYEKYIADWHFFLKGLQEYVMNLTSDSSSNSDSTARTISMHVLTQFYLTPYGEDGNFYEKFYERLEKVRSFLLNRLGFNLLTWKRPLSP